MTQQTKVSTLFDEYRVALLAWNDAIKNKDKDTGRVRLTALTYDKQRLALNKLQDEILKQAKVDRYWKRNGAELGLI